MKIGVIGAGVFGCTVLQEAINRGHEAHGFEANDSIMKGASERNHLRMHYGIHYPRCPHTIQQCQQGKKSFMERFPDCYKTLPGGNFAHIHADSRTSPEDFEKRFPNEIRYRSSNLNNSPRSCISSYSITEPMFLPSRFKALMAGEIGTNVSCTLPIQEIEQKTDYIRIRTDAGWLEELDAVIDCSYGAITSKNNFDPMLSYGPKVLKHESDVTTETVTMGVFYADVKPQGHIILDGPFGGIMSTEKEGEFTIWHVKKSIGPNYMADTRTIKKKLNDYLNVNFKAPMRCKQNLYVDGTIKVVKRKKCNTNNSRLSEVLKLGPRLYSIFSGKIITCVDQAIECMDLVEKDCANNWS